MSVFTNEETAIVAVGDASANVRSASALPLRVDTSRPRAKTRIESSLTGTVNMFEITRS
jgi:hypothetical protein